ncbi:MAG: AAA-like domain-containing protein [Fibromonadaceae bacterium]|jgi:hypothetical protein|nr:AAA-like domain-containing protein [Fibromonadaceae bacterium]
MLKKIFNIAGPCNSSEHYMLDPLRNIGEEVMDLIDSKHYFVIHSARQSGKTTFLWDFVDKIESEGKYYALYCSLEGVQELIEPERGIPAIVKSIKAALNDHNMPEGFAENADNSDITNVLRTSLSAYCRTLDKPLIILFDEADCLANGTLITFLRQLRNGYINRPRVPFVHSLALVGMRNIRDYKASIRDDSATLGSASPFNIVKETFTLPAFTRSEISELYSQHTAETGQFFEPQAVDHIFAQTQGQPWLVNAIARESVEKILRKDYSKPVTAEIAEQAISNIILARGTHFDSLIERLKEERVRKVIQPLILGGEVIDKTSDDYLYTRDLGLIRELGSAVEPANKIYAEIIIRILSQGVQDSVRSDYKDYEVPRYMKNGKIDMDFLVKDFQEFWRENSEIWIDRYKKDLYQYDEAAPHLVFQGFLQRVINGGGHVVREMALGTRRADLCVVYDGHKYPIELKILRNSRSVSEGLEQLSAYMDKCGTSEGWLVVFDRAADKSWDEKLYMRPEEHQGKRITVVGA